MYVHVHAAQVTTSHHITSHRGSQIPHAVSSHRLFPCLTHSLHSNLHARHSFKAPRFQTKPRKNVAFTFAIDRDTVEIDLVDRTVAFHMQYMYSCMYVYLCGKQRCVLVVATDLGKSGSPHHHHPLIQSHFSLRNKQTINQSTTQYS